jgi:hypothetical protein
MSTSDTWSPWYRSHGWRNVLQNKKFYPTIKAIHPASQRTERPGYSLRSTRNIPENTRRHAKARLVKESLPKVFCSMVQGECFNQLEKIHANSQDNPEDTTQWVEFYLKVFENDCPAFAANGLRHPNYHRPKPKKPPAKQAAEVWASSFSFLRALGVVPNRREVFNPIARASDPATQSGRRDVAASTRLDQGSRGTVVKCRSHLPVRTL